MYYLFLLIGVAIFLLLWLISIALRYWIAHQHRLEDLRMRQAIRDFESEKAKAIAVALAHRASLKVTPDRALEITQHWHTAARTTIAEASTVPPIEAGTRSLSLTAPTLPTSPAYHQIAHTIAPGRILLGYAASGPIVGDITDLLSTAIVGRPGTGKSTMLRFVVAMLLSIGGTPVLWDPHGSIVDELGDVLTVAESGPEITTSSSVIEQELEARLAARRHGATPVAPMLLIADEWPIISQIAPDAIQIARRVVLEGRKVGMYALICGQGLPAQLLGGTLVRDALSSRYVFNTTPAQARMAGLDNDTAKALLAQLDTSGPGKAILASATRRPEIVAIPATTADDIRSLVPGVPTRSSAVPTGVEPFPAFPVPGETIPGTGKNETSVEERERIIELARSGVPRREMCTRLGKGKGYYATVKAVLDEYEQEQEA